jgi:hypothetical protein
LETKTDDEELLEVIEKFQTAVRIVFDFLWRDFRETRRHPPFWLLLLPKIINQLAIWWTRSR